MEICLAKLNSNYTAEYLFNNDDLQMHLPIWTSLLRHSTYKTNDHNSQYFTEQSRQFGYNTVTR